MGTTRADLESMVERLIDVFHGNENPAGAEQVIALGFLVCARALRESSLMQEVAVREELQALDRHVREILESVRHTERSLDLERRGARRRTLVEDLTPSAGAPEERRAARRGPGR